MEDTAIADHIGLLQTGAFLNMDLQEFRLVIGCFPLPCEASGPSHPALTTNYYTSTIFFKTSLRLVCLLVSEASVFL